MFARGVSPEVATLILSDIRELKTTLAELTRNMVTRTELTRVEKSVEGFVPREELSQRWEGTDSRFDKAEKNHTLLEARVVAIERNQLPPWVLPAFGSIIALIVPVVTLFVAHFWSAANVTVR